MANKHVGVMLMTYGSPTTLDDIPVYLKHVYGGSTASPEVIAEFRRRYGLIGGSPPLHKTPHKTAPPHQGLKTPCEDGHNSFVCCRLSLPPPIFCCATTA